MILSLAKREMLFILNTAAPAHRWPNAYSGAGDAALVPDGEPRTAGGPEFRHKVMAAYLRTPDGGVGGVDFTTAELWLMDEAQFQVNYFTADKEVMGLVRKVWRALVGPQGGMEQKPAPADELERQRQFLNSIDSFLGDEPEKGADCGI